MIYTDYLLAQSHLAFRLMTLMIFKRVNPHYIHIMCYNAWKGRNSVLLTFIVNLLIQYLLSSLNLMVKLNTMHFQSARGMNKAVSLQNSLILIIPTAL